MALQFASFIVCATLVVPRIREHRCAASFGTQIGLSRADNPKPKYFLASSCRWQKPHVRQLDVGKGPQHHLGTLLSAHMIGLVSTAGLMFQTWGPKETLQAPQSRMTQGSREGVRVLWSGAYGGERPGALLSSDPSRLASLHESTPRACSPHICSAVTDLPFASTREPEPASARSRSIAGVPAPAPASPPRHRTRPGTLEEQTPCMSSTLGAQ